VLPSSPENHRHGRCRSCSHSSVSSAGLSRGANAIFPMPSQRGAAVAVILCSNRAMPCHAHDFTPHWALLHKTVPVDSCRMIHLRPFREVYFLSTLQLFPSVLPLPITSSLGIPLLFRVHGASYQNSRKLSASTRNKLTKKDAFN
jgi:hypothetical protein